MKTTEITDTVAVDDIQVSAYTIPCDGPESDGTVAWDSTTMVVVKVKGGGREGVGYTYADASAAYMIDHSLKQKVKGKNAMSPSAITDMLVAEVRNNGQCGIATMAVSAVDMALWDLKCRILDISLCELLGRQRDAITVYGSGGFTSYTLKKIQQQLSRWVEMGLKQVKIKIGREPDKDIARVIAARQAITDRAELFVDANGAYTTKQATGFANAFADYNVKWFEEPVPQRDLEGMRFVRENAPAGMNIATGEYGYGLPDFHDILKSECADVLQADATRCGGITGFMRAGVLGQAWRLPFSGHCAPSAHLLVAMCVPGFYTSEYFHDHARIEKMLLDGFAEPIDGAMKPDRGRPGLGFDFKYKDAEKYKI